MKRLWQNSLLFKFFLTYLAVVALLFTTFYFYSSTAIRDAYISSLGERMEREARLLARTLPFIPDNQALDGLCRNLAHDVSARITVVDMNGRVSCDSAEASETMENQGKDRKLPKH